MLSIRHARFLAALTLSVAVMPTLASDQGNGSTGHPSSTNGVADFGDELLPPIASPQAYAPAPAGARVLWFVPSDHDTSTTCLFFMNAAPVQQSVLLQGFTPRCREVGRGSAQIRSFGKINLTTSWFFVALTNVR